MAEVESNLPKTPKAAIPVDVENPLERTVPEEEICQDRIIYDSSKGLTIGELCQKLTQQGKYGLADEYEALPLEHPELSAKAFNRNPSKNRYKNVICYDHNRVVLEGKMGDYIHASFVHGFRHKYEYICTQGPTKDTLIDFWRMIWQEKVLVIVSLTKMMEGGREKCHQYWPSTEGKSVGYGNMVVHCRRIITSPDGLYSRSEILIKPRKANEQDRRTVIHLLYLDWPDFGTPQDSQSFFSFVKVVHHEQREQLKIASFWQGCTEHGPPIVVHCSAGAGRTGTLVALDICTKQLSETGRLDIQGVVHSLRRQRYNSIQKPDQYNFLILAIVEFALTNNLVQAKNIDLSKFIEIEPGEELLHVPKKPEPTVEKDAGKEPKPSAPPPKSAPEPEPRTGVTTKTVTEKHVPSQTKRIPDKTVSAPAKKMPEKLTGKVANDDNSLSDHVKTAVDRQSRSRVSVKSKRHHRNEIDDRKKSVKFDATRSQSAPEQSQKKEHWWNRIFGRKKSQSSRKTERSLASETMDLRSVSLRSKRSRKQTNKDSEYLDASVAPTSSRMTRSLRTRGRKWASRRSSDLLDRRSSQ